jgi:hypothetical protein
MNISGANQVRIVAAALFGAYTLAVGFASADDAHDNAQAFPDIGTRAYMHSCTITHAWEDHSAIAYCAEDGVTYSYDADGNDPPASVAYTGPRWSAGWYPCADDCLRGDVDHGRRVG